MPNLIMGGNFFFILEPINISERTMKARRVKSRVNSTDCVGVPKGGSLMTNNLLDELESESESLPPPAFPPALLFVDALFLGCWVDVLGTFFPVSSARDS